MGILDDVNQMRSNSNANAPQMINGVQIPNAAKMGQFDQNYLDQGAPQAPDNSAAAGKISQIVQKLQIQPTEDNLQNVIMGVAKGRPMDPVALIKDRKASLQQELDETLNTLRNDPDFNQYMSATKSAQDRQLREASYGGGKYDKDAADRRIDPMLKMLGEKKFEIFGKRAEIIQNQLNSLEGTQNKLILGGALHDDNDYQDMIKALIAGGTIPTSNDRAALELSKEDLERKKLKDQQDVAVAGLTAKNEADKTAFNQAAETTKIGIMQQNADSQRISASKQSSKSQNAITALKNKQAEVQTTLNLTKDIAQKFNPDFFEKPEQWKNAGLAFLDSMGVNIGDANKATIKAFNDQSQGVGQLFNQYRKMITGSAAAVQELEMLKKDFVNKNNSPEQARAGLQRFLKMTIRDSKIFQEMIDSGININDKNELNGFYDTAKFRYDLDDPALVEEAVRAAPQLFYDGPMEPRDKQILKEGGKMLKVRGKWNVYTPSQVELLKKEGEID